VRTFVGRAVDRLAPLSARALANPRRAAGAVAGISLVSVGLYYSAHFALHHRSRCPAVTVAAANPAGDTGAASAGKPRPLSLKVDDAGAISRGGDAEVYYDVCGLEKGTSFTTSVTITKSESGLNRLLGRGAGSVRGKYDEAASGPATRRHRTLDMDGMPAGTYQVNVVVVDEKGRRREEATSLRIRGEE
jgi:hypothetical protein